MYFKWEVIDVVVEKVLGIVENHLRVFGDNPKSQNELSHLAQTAFKGNENRLFELREYASANKSKFVGHLDL